MAQKEVEVKVTDDYVKWLSELDKKSGLVAGGKGANLAEMYNAKMPIPPAFVVTAQAFQAFIRKSGLGSNIKEILSNTDVNNTKQLEENAAKIRSIIIASKMPKDMEEEIVEAYEILGTEKETKEAQERKIISQGAIDILKTSKEPIFVAVRSSATTEDLATASFAGQQDTYTNIKGNGALVDAVKRCFASLYTARAIFYRNKKGFKEEEALLAVVVQKMVNSDKSGVIFTKNPMTRENEVAIEAVFGLGEGIVSGKVKPDQYIVSTDLKIKKKDIAEKKLAVIRSSSGEEHIVELTEQKSKEQVLEDSEIISLADTSIKIENHYKHPQDIEFAVEGDEIYIVQSRPITTLDIEKKVVSVKGEVILTGLAASPGVAYGKVKIIHDLADLDKIKEGDVLVTKMTNPDMVVTMQKSAAVITDEGGATAHAAIVSREMGIPAVVGTDKATTVLKDDMLVTIDGTNGKIYSGAEIEGGPDIGKKKVLPVIKGTKTKIKVIVDLPDFAERAAKSEVDAVGLMRIEGIIASSGKHPMHFENKKEMEDYVKILEEGIGKISKHFKEVWIRTSDIRTDEYRNLMGAPKEQEVNPMLGFHGIRFSLKHPAILEAEFEAIKRVAEANPDKIFGIMFPQVISEDEVVKASKILRENYDRENIKIGAMIETPASVQIIRKLCKHVKFISFGTNDLTQYTLAIDRGNSDVQYLYDEAHPSILSQMRRVINITKEYGVESSICGQAGSKKEVVEYLVKQGIDSISVNADMAAEISKFVKELEQGGNPEKNKNKHKRNKKMKNKDDKILPVDDTSRIEKKEKKIKKQVEEAKEELEEEREEAGTTEVEKEEVPPEKRAEEGEKEAEEEKKEEEEAEEFPDIDIGVDIFKPQ